MIYIQVGDFGLSKIKRNTLVSGGVRGTLPWMAPELLNGSSNKVSEKVYNHSSWVFSAVVLGGVWFVECGDLFCSTHIFVGLRNGMG